MRYLKIFISLLILFSAASFGGDLIYRDSIGATGVLCDIKSVNGVKVFKPAYCTAGGRACFPDRYDTVPGTTATLSCNNAVVSVRRSLIPQDCIPARGCNPVPRVTYENDTVNYDFNYDLPGVDVLFGSISKKSPSNVFLSRPLSKNYIAYSNDGVLDKPVIIVEGYDPTDSLFPNHYFNAGFNQLLMNGVNNNGGNGRDLFIVNLPHGASKISENAAFLQKIIVEINGAKVGNAPAVVIGYSMGGLVARKALKNMELSGINHKTSIYVSYDAPHLGANAPLDIQGTVDGLVDKLDDYVAGYTSSSLKRARYIYNSPAAREMLIAAPEFKPATAADFPEQLVRIAVSSGSLLGVNAKQVNSVYEGEKIAAFKFYLYKNWNGTLSESYEWYSKKRGGIYYDNVPGSYAESFSDAYQELKNGADYLSEYQAAEIRNITFVPTISSLAIPVDPNAAVKSLFLTKSPFDKYIAVDDVSGMHPCDTFRLQSAEGQNLYHSIGDAYFHYGQLMQLRCALDTYQVEGVRIPDRSFKRY
ncbi:esterase/lipase family protein [Cellvibrio sp.]